jgi:predicted phage terminase large subunit-like protein
MFKKMRQQVTQQKDVWGREWALFARRVLRALSARIQTCFGRSASERQEPVSVVRTTSSGTSSSIACPPHRLCEDQQPPEQSNLVVRELSRWDARFPETERELEFDVVESVEVAEEVDFTYNLEIENTHNYFANGILLHNCDDAHGAQDAQSDTMRGSTLEWLDMVWSSRKNDPRTSCSVVIMQRLHAMDATGHLLKQGGYEHLCLPAEYDGVKRRTSLGEYDPRTEVGELLWPNRFGKTELDTLKKALGAYGASGQLQQNPVPSGGGILKIDHVQLWPYTVELPDFQYIVISLDTAFTEKTSGDPTGCIVFGVFTHRKQQCVMVLDAWTDHLSYPDLKEHVMDDWRSSYGAVEGNVMKKGRRADTLLIEAKASGQSLLQDMRLSNIPAISYNPGKADKVQRAHMTAPILESDCVYVMESKKRPGEPISWAKPMLKEWETFPVAEHDEYVDCLTQTIIYLKDSGWLEVPVHEDDEPDRYTDDDRSRSNPYAQ